MATPWHETKRTMGPEREARVQEQLAEALQLINERKEQREELIAPLRAVHKPL
jgi:hypothetical protein